MASFDIGSMDEQSLQPYLSQLRFSQANKLRLFQKFTNAREPREPSHQNILSIDEIRQRGLQYKHLFLESMKRKRNDPSIFLIIGGGNGNHQPYSITRAAFIELLRTCRLPRAFVQSANCNNGALGHHVNYSGTELNSKPSDLSIVIETPYTPFHDFSMAARIDVQNGALIGMLFSKKEANIPRIIERLERRFKESVNSPFTLIVMLYEDYGIEAEHWRKELDSHVVRIEQTTGMTSLALTDDELQELEYERLIRDLHACNTDLIFLSDLINFEIEFGEFCYKTFEIFEDLRKRLGRPVFHGPQFKDEIHNRLAFLLKISHFRQRQTQSLKLRIQSQTALIYSLVSQRDSRVNLIIAEGSRGIALAAQQDSRTMRTIGFLTLVFLPGSLVASVFSTGIFDLSNQKDGKVNSVVAPLWWIFVLATVVFTSAVILVWWIWHRRALGTFKIASSKKPEMV